MTVSSADTTWHLLTTMEALLERFTEPLKTALDPLRNLVRPEEAPLWQGQIGSFNVAFYPSQFYIQGVLVALAVAYGLFALVGRWRNQRAAQPFEEVFGRVLQGEFAQVGASAEAPELVWNGAADAMFFASGRRGVEYMHATLKLQPRHDVLMHVGSFLYDALALPATPFSVSDHVTLTFRLPRNERTPIGTFAVIDKHDLQRVRAGRYDLSFAKVADGENASGARALDERFAIAAENGNVVDKWLGESGQRGDEQRKRLGLVDALNGPGGRFVVSLVCTDQPSERPQNGAVPLQERLALTLRLPRSKAEAEAQLPVLTAVFDVIDALHLTATGRENLMALRPETQAALKRTRTEVNALLDKEVAQFSEEGEKESREEARRKAQQEKFDKLSPAEQAKRKQVEKKRAQRKAQTAALRSRQ